MAHREPIETETRSYAAIFERMASGEYLVSFPDIPDLATWGKNVDHARAMAAECLSIYLEGLAADGLPLPEPDKHPGPVTLENVRIELKKSA
ncbi:MAG: type II toxin-antitoxin system HicB family antitoxin [Rhodospirillales bacterium]